MPGVHRVASLAERWLLGTHQGSVDEAHLPVYLNEFVFRFNRRRCRSRGLVFDGCLNSPSLTNRCATGISFSTHNRSEPGVPFPADGASRPLWSGRPRTDHGERPDQHSSG